MPLADLGGTTLASDPMDMDEKFLNIKALAKYRVAAQRESSPHKEGSVSVTGIFRP